MRKDSTNAVKSGAPAIRESDRRRVQVIRDSYRG